MPYASLASDHSPGAPPSLEPTPSSTPLLSASAASSSSPQLRSHAASAAIARDTMFWPMWELHSTHGMDEEILTLLSTMVTAWIFATALVEKRGLITSAALDVSRSWYDAVVLALKAYVAAMGASPRRSTDVEEVRSLFAAICAAGEAADAHWLSVFGGELNINSYLQGAWVAAHHTTMAAAAARHDVAPVAVACHLREHVTGNGLIRWVQAVKGGSLCEAAARVARAWQTPARDCPSSAAPAPPPYHRPFDPDLFSMYPQLQPSAGESGSGGASHESPSPHADASQAGNGKASPVAHVTSFDAFDARRLVVIKERDASKKEAFTLREEAIERNKEKDAKTAEVDLARLAAEQEAALQPPPPAQEAAQQPPPPEQDAAQQPLPRAYHPRRVNSQPQKRPSASRKTRMRKADTAAAMAETAAAIAAGKPPRRTRATRLLARSAPLPSSGFSAALLRSSLLVMSLIAAFLSASLLSWLVDSASPSLLAAHAHVQLWPSSAHYYQAAAVGNSSVGTTPAARALTFVAHAVAWRSGTSTQLWPPARYLHDAASGGAASQDASSATTASGVISNADASAPDASSSSATTASGVITADASSAPDASSSTAHDKTPWDGKVSGCGGRSAR